MKNSMKGCLSIEELDSKFKKMEKYIAKNVMFKVSEVSKTNDSILKQFDGFKQTLDSSLNLSISTVADDSICKIEETNPGKLKNIVEQVVQQHIANHKEKMDLKFESYVNEINQKFKQIESGIVKNCKELSENKSALNSKPEKYINEEIENRISNLEKTTQTLEQKQIRFEEHEAQLLESLKSICTNNVSLFSSCFNKVNIMLEKLNKNTFKLSNILSTSLEYLNLENQKGHNMKEYLYDDISEKIVQMSKNIQDEFDIILENVENNTNSKLDFLKREVLGIKESINEFFSKEEDSDLIEDIYLKTKSDYKHLESKVNLNVKLLNQNIEILDTSFKEVVDKIKLDCFNSKNTISTNLKNLEIETNHKIDVAKVQLAQNEHINLQISQVKDSMSLEIDKLDRNIQALWDSFALFTSTLK